MRLIQVYIGIGQAKSPNVSIGLTEEKGAVSMGGSRTRRYRQIADEIAGGIASGRFVPGKRLPPERELSVMFEVSRPTLREAIIALELMGQVEVRGGSGVYVLNTPAKTVRTGSEPGIFETLEARMLIEPGVAEVAARAIDDEAMRILRAHVAEMIEAFETDRLPDQADERFHLALAEVTGNTAIIAAVRQLWNLRARSDTLRHLEDHAGVERVRLTAIEDHVRILSALSSRDAEAARRAMAQHMENNVNVLLATSARAPAGTKADAVSRMRLKIQE